MQLCRQELHDSFHMKSVLLISSVHWCDCSWQLRSKSYHQSPVTFGFCTLRVASVTRLKTIFSGNLWNSSFKKYHEHLTSLPTNLFKHNALYKSQTSDIEHTENTWWRETWPTTPQYRNIKQVHLAHVKQMAFYPFTVHGYERHRALTSLRKKEGNVTDKNVQYHILSLFFLL